MIDINNIINTAIAEAVNARITEVLAQHANAVGGLTERIDTLEKNEEALVRRIAALENNPAIGVGTALGNQVQCMDTDMTALKERIATLEQTLSAMHNVTDDDLVLFEQRIAALEGDVSHTVQVQQANITAALAERVAALENNPAGTPATITADAFVTHLDNQEWFWEKLTRKAHEAAEAAVEEAMDEHTSTYDHDDYDTHLGDDDKHFDGDIEDAVRDALNGTSVTLSF